MLVGYVDIWGHTLPVAAVRDGRVILIGIEAFKKVQVIMEAKAQLTNGRRVTRSARIQCAA